MLGSLWMEGGGNAGLFVDGRRRDAGLFREEGMLGSFGGGRRDAGLFGEGGRRDTEHFGEEGGGMLASWGREGGGILSSLGEGY